MILMESGFFVLMGESLRGVHGMDHECAQAVFEKKT